MFKKRRGIDIDYAMQGLICFTCLTFESQPKRIKERIIKICESVAGDKSDALFELLTTDKSVTAVAMKHYVSESTLSSLRAKFYMRWVEQGKKFTNKSFKD